MGGKNNKWTQDIIFGKHLKKRQLDAQFIFSIFRQTLPHVSAVSIPNQQEEQPYVSNSGYLIFFLDVCLLCWLGYSNIKYTLFYTYSRTS